MELIFYAAIKEGAEINRITSKWKGEINQFKQHL